MNKKVFLSLTGLLHAYDNGEVTFGDLATALFFFGCTRRVVFETNPLQSVSFLKCPERASWMLGAVREAVLYAESQNRAAFREGEERTYEELNALLAANGYLPLEYEGYCADYATLAKELLEVNPELVPRWRGSSEFEARALDVLNQRDEK